jgi:predicted Zn-dependent protease
MSSAGARWPCSALRFALACALFGCAARTEPPVTQPEPSGDDSAWPAAAKHLVPGASGQASIRTPDPVVEVLAEELQRAFTVLEQKPAPAHFLSYQVTDEDNWRLAASHGALLGVRHDRQRSLDVDLRVGSAERDSTHRLPGEGPTAGYRGVRALPLFDLGQALRDALWLATDDEYESARQAWMRVQSSQEREEQQPATKAAPMADFSKEPPVAFYQDKLETVFDEVEWTARLKRLSLLGSKYPAVMGSQVSLQVITESRYLVSSEGSRVQSSDRRVRLAMEASTIAIDGMLLSRFDAVDVHSLEALPTEAELNARFERLFTDVQALEKAPLIDPYAGPAILDGRAAGVFFHEIFGHRIEGHRQDDDSEGQTFATLVGQAIMDETLDIYDDPSLFTLNGVELNGHYQVDDEGVVAERARLVEAGVLRGFLLSRAPTRGFVRSNGHGRREPGYDVVARQANLVVEPRRVISPKMLEQALLREVARQGLPYGLRFSEITGGFTQTQRGDTQAFKVVPVMVYRVYPDGREELVRGVDIEGTPLTALSKIVAAANDFQTFNGVCGAESGWVPVSATSPSILVSQIEVARQEQSELKPPVLSPPAVGVER